MRTWLRLTYLFGPPDDKAESGNIICASIGLILRADADDLVHGPLPEQLAKLLRKIARAERELAAELLCGYSRLRSTWWPSWPSGRGSHLPDPSPLSGTPERSRDGRSADRGHPERPVPTRCFGPRRTTTPTSFASAHAKAKPKGAP